MTIILRSARVRTPGLIASMVLLCVVLAHAGVAGQSWHAQYFPNVELTTHPGARVHVYKLIKGKTVAIELIYTSYRLSLPVETARSAQVHDPLGDRMAKDVFFLTNSTDPAHHTPAVLRAFAEKYHAGPA